MYGTYTHLCRMFGWVNSGRTKPQTEHFSSCNTAVDVVQLPVPDDAVSVCLWEWSFLGGWGLGAGAAH